MKIKKKKNVMYFEFNNFYIIIYNINLSKKFMK